MILIKDTEPSEDMKPVRISASRGRGGDCKERLPIPSQLYGIGTDWKHISAREGGYIAHPDPQWWLGGFSGGSSSDGLTEEQEWEIAENIFDWWISGKSYKKWYAEKFLQTEIEFKE